MITPGSWKIDGGKGKDGDLYIWKDGNYFGGHAIATVHGEIQEGAKGNAQLISAAPDMLEALESLFENCQMIHTHWGENCNQREADAAIAAAHAAVAKARGIK